MAGEDDVIRLDEEEDSKLDDLEEPSKKNQSTDNEKEKKKRLIKLGSIAGGVVLVVLTVLIFLLSGDDEAEKVDEQVESAEIARKILAQDIKPVDRTRLEEMIKKANLLYHKGDRLEALNLYENISVFSEGLSLYNLGVAQMKESAYDEAIDTFQKAIDIGEDRVFSSINAAVSALELGDENLFRYYIDLASIYLPEASDLDLYSYLYSLVEYYRGNYFEALTPLNNQTSEFYQESKNHILSKIYLYFNQNYKAIDHLERDLLDADQLSLGLLYARVGEYNLAQNHLIRHINSGNDDAKSHMALALVDIKAGNLLDAAGILENMVKKNEKDAVEAYPIRTKLVDSLFDINEAQKNFMEDFNLDRRSAYKVLFYFAPYRVFDIKQAFDYIEKGGVNILLEEIDEAKNILIKGSTISRVNINIAKAIKESMRYRVRDTNDLLRDVVEQYPNHSILHYNLGLSYTHLGDFDSAYKHFIRSYHLNNKDILAGIFAMICAKTTGREYGRVLDSLTEELGAFAGADDERTFYLTLINYFQDNVITSIEWLDMDKRERPIYFALDVLISHALRDGTRYPRSAKKLLEMFPNDVVANIFNLMANNLDIDIKELSLKSQDLYKDTKLNMDSIYYGASIVREMYIKYAYIVGTSHVIKEKLEDRILTETEDVRGVIQALALNYIYAKEFEKAFALYNELIDNFDEKDSNTLFLAAISAIAADQKANAIALLELSKLTDKSNLEGRYALGLLYHEAKNLKGAAIQYSAIGNVGFTSEYFDFEIDIDEYNRLRVQESLAENMMDSNQTS